MKKIRNIVFTSLICSLFFSCSNFMQGTGFIEELKDAIEYTAAPEIKVFVMVDDSDSGSTIPSGEQSYKLSQQYSAIYKPSSKYVLKNWEAVNKDGTAFEEPVVEFTSDIKSNEVNFKIIKNVENILIRPVVVQKLTSDSVYPPNDNNSYPCDSTISIVFNKNLAPDNDLSKIDIKWQDTSVKSNYKEPVINNNILTIPADKNNLIRFTNDGTKSITVTIPADFYYLSDDEKICIGEEIKWSFLINPQTNSKVEVTFGVDEQYGTITPEGTKTYNIGESFNVTLTKNEYIDLQNWSIVDGDGNEITEDSISIKEDDEVFTFTILKELTAVSISPVCFVTPQIVKIEPEYSLTGAPFDSDITIYFNKPIADIDFITNGFKLTDVNNTVDFKPLYRAELSEDKKVLKYIFNLDYSYINQIQYLEYGYNIYKNVMNKNNSDYVNLYVKIVDASIKDLDENVFYPEGYSYTIRINNIQTKKPVTLENVQLCLSDSVKRSSTNEYGLNYYELNNNPVFFKSYTDDQLDKIGSSTELPSDLKDNFIILYGADLQMAGYTTNSDDDNEYIYAQLNCEYDNRRPFTFNMEVYKYSEDTIPTEGYLYIKKKYKYLVSKYSYEIAQQLENSKDNIISIPKSEAFGAINETGTYLFKFYLQNDDGKTNPFYSFVSIYSNYDELLGKANVVIEPNNAYFYHPYQTKVTEENITLEINDYISKTLKFKFKKQTHQWNNDAVTYLIYSNAGQIPITYDIINDSKVLCFITNNAGENENTKFIVYNEVYTPFFDSMNFTTSVKYKSNINNDKEDVVTKTTNELTDNQNIVITPIIELHKEGMIYLTIELKPISYIYNHEFKINYPIPDFNFTNTNNTFTVTTTETLDEDYQYFVIYTDYEDNINKIFGINKIENPSSPTDSIKVQTNSIMPFIVKIDNNGNFNYINIDDGIINDDSIDFEPPTISSLDNLKWNALGQYMIPISDDNNFEFTKEYEYTWTENKLQNFDSHEIKKFKGKIIHVNSTDDKEAYLLVQRPFRAHRDNKNTFNLSVKLSDEKGNEKIYYNILADKWENYEELEFLSTTYSEFMNPTSLPFRGNANYPGSGSFMKIENDLDWSSYTHFDFNTSVSTESIQSIDLIENKQSTFEDSFYATTFEGTNTSNLSNPKTFRTVPIFRYYSNSTSPVSVPYKRVYSDDQNISVDINDTNKALIIYYVLPSEVLKTEEGTLLTYKDLTPEIMVKSGVIHSMEIITGRHTLTKPDFTDYSQCTYMAKIVFQDNSIEYSKIYINE